MRDLIPLPQPANTWRGFLLRVIVIAIAASVVLGIAALAGFTFDTFGASPRPVAQPAQPVAPATAPGEN